MKSIIVRLALILAAFAIVPDALAADTGGDIFLDAKFGAMLGKGQSTGDVGSSGDSKTAWGADGGYLWKLDDMRLWGFEAGYMHFGQISNDSNAEVSITGDTTARAITAGVRLQFLLGGDRATFLQVRGGLASVTFDQESSFSSIGLPASNDTESFRENGSYFGIGIGRLLTQNFSVLLAYNNYNAPTSDRSSVKLNVNWIGLVAEYRF